MPLLLFLQLFVTALLYSTGKADDPTQKPSYNCQEGGALISHLSAQCDLNQFSGLNSYPPAQVLYEIVNQATTVPNSTFYKNGTNVSCLFKGKNFVLNGIGGGIGAGPASITFTPNVEAEGTMCVFPEDVPKGGLTLGEIRQLAHELISHCNKCGRITANYFSKNENQTGWLKFDWKQNSVCIDDCIDPAVDFPVTTTTTTSAVPTQTPSAATKKASGNPALDRDAVSLLLCGLMFLFGVAMVVM